MWQQYLERLRQAGVERKPPAASAPASRQSHLEENLSAMGEQRRRRFRLPAGPRGRQGAKSRRRIRFRRAALRPDERPDVARGCIACGSASQSTRAACAPGSACSTWRAAPAISRRSCKRASAPTGEVVVDGHQRRNADPRPRPPARRRARLLPAVQCDAERLPFPDEYFDCVIVAFGLRNMTHKEVALAEMHRVLRAGGRLLVLEFSQVWSPLKPAVRRLFVPGAARARQAGRRRCGQLSLPRRIDPHAPGPGRAQADDGTGGLRAGRISTT